MTATISFYDDTEFPFGTDMSDTLRTVLTEWQDSGLSGSHPTNTGGFFGGTTFSGTSYSYVSGTGNYSFQVTGDLDYYFAGVSSPPVAGATNHTLYGEIDTITIGGGLDGSGNVTTPIFTFDFDAPLVGDLLDGRTNVVHDVIWGLMNGSVTGATDSLGTISPGGLIDALEDNGLDVDLSVADLTFPSLLSESELLLAA